MVLRNVVSKVGMGIVAVYAKKLNRFSVYEKFLLCADSNSAHTDLNRYEFIFAFENKCVEIRSFGGPLIYVFDVKLTGVILYGFFLLKSFVVIEESYCAISVFNGFDTDNTVVIIVFEISIHGDIGNAGFITRQQINVAENTCLTEAVLILEIGGITPF